jgi:hypothetical protein
MEQRMAEYGSQDAWPRVGERYVELFRKVSRGEPIDEYLALQPEFAHT